MWPDAVTYREAVQEPTQAFHDPTLANGKIRLDRLGLPVAYTGRFAVVFPLTDDSGAEWAVRCFTTPERSGEMPRALRYALIDRHLERLPQHFVDFVFHERGIRVAGRWYPAIAMGWASGTTLGRWTEANYRNPDALRTLAATLDELRRDLEDAGIAHGDWQHDNLLVADGGKRAVFVDYDGMFVPELSGTHAPERGHPNYQHPARTPAHFGVGLDRFPCLVARVALLALAVEPGLWERFSDPDRLLFSKSDLSEPSSGPLFDELAQVAERDADLRESLVALRKSLEDGERSELLPAKAPESAPLAPLAKLALAEESDEETWWSVADENAPWWRQKVSSRRIALDSDWVKRLAEITVLLDNPASVPVLRLGSQVIPLRPTLESERRLLIYRKIQEAEAILDLERRRHQRKLDEIRSLPNLSERQREHLVQSFVHRQLLSIPIPADFPPRVRQAKITNAGTLQRHRAVLPKFLRVEECKQAFRWLDSVVAECEAALAVLVDPKALAVEEGKLIENLERLELVTSRLSALKERTRSIE